MLSQASPMESDPTTSLWISASLSPQFRALLSCSEELRGPRAQVLEEQGPSSSYRAPEALRALEDTLDGNIPKGFGGSAGLLGCFNGVGKGSLNIGMKVKDMGTSLPAHGR